MIRDVFLCHASEDKHSIVRSLHEGLTKSGITCWLDEAEVRWGDSIVEKVQEGLRESQFVIVVLSKTFLAKPWQRRELAAALSVEASTGGVRVLPLLAGDEREKRAILKEFPLLADKLYLVWDGDPSRVIQAMVRRLQKNRGSEAELLPPLNIPRFPLRIAFIAAPVLEIPPIAKRIPVIVSLRVEETNIAFIAAPVLEIPPSA